MARTTLPQLKKRIARNVRALREDAGLSQYALGKAMGVDPGAAQSSVSHMESGSRGLSLEMVVRLCRVLGVDPVSIFKA